MRLGCLYPGLAGMPNVFLLSEPGPPWWSTVSPASHKEPIALLPDDSSGPCSGAAGGEGGLFLTLYRGSWLKICLAGSCSLPLTSPFNTGVWAFSVGSLFPILPHAPFTSIRCRCWGCLSASESIVSRRQSGSSCYCAEGSLGWRNGSS